MRAGESDGSPDPSCRRTTKRLGRDPAQGLGYNRLMLAAEDARRLMPEFSERADASTARLDVESGLQLLTGHRSDGGFALDPESAPGVVQRKATLAALTSQAKRRGRPLGDAGGGISIGEAPLSILEAWVRDRPPHPRRTGKQALGGCPGPVPGGWATMGTRL